MSRVCISLQQIQTVLASLLIQVLSRKYAINFREFNEELYLCISTILLQLLLAKVRSTAPWTDTYSMTEIHVVYIIPQ